jgi:G3E family GTPase
VTDSEIDSRIPVTVITGFLGSGKTTLLNRVLTEQHGMRIAVIENEFGEVGIDDALVLNSDEEVFEMNNGCICCTVRGDLIRILENLLLRKGRFDRVLIETTGLADPAPVAQTFFMDDEIRSNYRLDAILTVIDSLHTLQHLKEKKPEGTENEAVEQVAFADKILLNKIDLVDEQSLQDLQREISSINSTAEHMKATFGRFPLHDLLDIRAFDLDKVLETEPTFLEATEHQHDQSVASVGIDIEGELDLDLLDNWMAYLLGEKGVDIFRSKGILAIAGSDKKYIFQAVHMLFTGEFANEWGSEPRRNKMVFIGRNLDRQELTEGFMKCIKMPDTV